MYVSLEQNTVDMWYSYYDEVFFSKIFFYLPSHTGSKPGMKLFSSRAFYLSFKVFVKRFHNVHTGNSLCTFLSEKAKF